MLQQNQQNTSQPTESQHLFTAFTGLSILSYATFLYFPIYYQCIRKEPYTLNLKQTALLTVAITSLIVSHLIFIGCITTNQWENLDEAKYSIAKSLEVINTAILLFLAYITRITIKNGVINFNYNF